MNRRAIFEPPSEGLRQVPVDYGQRTRPGPWIRHGGAARGYGGLMRLRCATMACLGAVLCAGCGSSQNDAVQGAVRRFEAAVTAKDSASACGLLAPATRYEVETSASEPCIKAWPAEG